MFEGTLMEQLAPKCFRTPLNADEHHKKRSRSCDDNFDEDEPATSRQNAFARDSRSTGRSSGSSSSSSAHYMNSLGNSGTLSRNSD